MGRIHDALRRAEQARERVLEDPPAAGAVAPPVPSAVSSPVRPLPAVSSGVRTTRLHRTLDRLPALADYSDLQWRVIQLRGQRLLRSLAIAGAALDDGRTSTALQLARSLAKEAGLEVCLVDLDLEHPGLSSWLEEPPPVGVEDVLEDRVSLDEALVNIEGSTLYVLPSRSTLSASHPAAWSGVNLVAVAKLADRLHQRFDLTLVDAPALLTSGPGADLVGDFDAWILVIRAGVTTTHDIDSILERLDGDRLVGTVLTRSRLYDGSAPELLGGSRRLRMR